MAKERKEQLRHLEGILLRVSGQEGTKPSVKKQRFPWLLLLALLGTIYLFWILPYQIGERPVRVEFSREP